MINSNFVSQRSLRKAFNATVSSAAIVCAAAALFPQNAFAQSGASPKADSPDSEMIIVTGSRIVQNGYNTPTPVTVLSTETLEQFAAPSIPEALREVPALIKTTGPTASPSTSSADPSASAGTFLNLRNLGPQRGLLLQDGMRVPPTRADGLTDANIIPQMLISRVDFVTGGASAAYGSDAVAGVVNYIMDNRFTGLKGLVQLGTSQRDDMHEARLGLAVGQSFLDDRLHIVASGEYRKNTGINSFCDRPYGCDSYIFGNAAGGSTAGLSNQSPVTPLSLYKDAFLVRLPYDGYLAGVFNADGVTANAGANAQLANKVFSYGPGGATLRPYNAGTLINSSTCLSCDGSHWSPGAMTLVPETANAQAYAHAEFDVTPNFTLFAQGSYGRSEINENTGNYSWFGRSGLSLPIYSGNAYLSPAIQQVLTDNNAAMFELDRSTNSAAGDILNGDYRGVAENWAVTVGAKGKIGNNWRWNIYGVDSKSTNHQTGRQSENAKLYAALDAVKDSNGNIVCRVTLTNPTTQPGCVPLNLFGSGSPSTAAKNYIQGRYDATQSTTLKGFGGEITGTLFENWAGPVGIAAGFEWRKQALDVVSNQSDIGPTAGIRYGWGSPLRYWAVNIFPTSGSYTVREGFGEVEVPLLKDSPLAKNLSVNGAVRLTDYSTSGKVTAWKLGGSWEVNDDIRIRVTRSRDVRAPTLNDLYAPRSSTLLIFTDIHTNNTTSSINQISQGNVKLRPELADTWTLGGIVSPSFIPGLTASVDWYNIKIGNAIQSFGAAQMVQICETSNGTSELCSAVVRPGPFSDRSAANFPTTIFAQSFNAVGLQTKGIDFDVSYRTRLGGGQLNLHALATYQYVYKSQSSPQNPLINSAGYITAGGTPSPKLVMAASAGYKVGNFGINVQERRIGSWSLAAPPGTPGTVNVYQDPIVKAVYYTDLGVTYDLKIGSAKRMQLFANVGNLFDRKPPLLPPASNPGIQYPTQRSLYDVVLRDFTLGLRFQY